jgi:hypothetical protein
MDGCDIDKITLLACEYTDDMREQKIILELFEFLLLNSLDDLQGNGD